MKVQLPNDQQTSGYHHWRCLTFLHWRVDAADLRSLVPAGLEIDQFDGSAWLGLVPFSMEQIRPWWAPAVPGISWFLETNVRTYVTDRNGTPGVWFFSLDANQWLAVKLARGFWHLPYEHAALELKENYSTARPATLVNVRYSGTRRRDPSIRYDLEIEPTSSTYSVSPSGSLDEFLLERYILFAERPGGQLFSGRVHHDPYQFVSAKVRALSQTMTRPVVSNISAGQMPDHAAFCPGVHVRVSPIRALPK